MKKLQLFAGLLLLMAAITPGCTHNNGDIGPLFGRWTLESVVSSNCPQIETEGDLFWAFQSNVIKMTQNLGETIALDAYGTWRLDDNTLFLDFSDPDRPILPVFGLPKQCELEVVTISKGKLILIYHPTDDSSVQYTFRKW